MTYKTILVCLTDKDSAKKLIDFSVMVAEQYDAHLIGVHVAQEVEMHSTISPYISGDLLDRLTENMREESEEFAKIFKSCTAGRPVVSEWRPVTARADAISEAIIEHALPTDLIIMAQPSDRNNAQDQHELHRKLILGAGRPILVMPLYGTFDSIGDKVILAWNGTRESARAAHDAVPFMLNASEVVILGVEGKNASENDLRVYGHDLAVSLARHGIKSNVTNYRKGDIAISDELLNAVSDRGADLIVMGAYGHSRVYDFVLGAATSGILAHMTVPTLFAH